MRRIKDWLEPERNFLLATLGVSLLLRLAYVIKTGSGGLSPDSYDWMNTAWSIASGEGFGGSWRPPGYAFYLAGVFLIFGKSVIAAKLMNALLGTATVGLVYFTARALFNARTARITAALLSYYPYLIAYAGDLLSETFLTFMLALAVFAVVRASAVHSWKNVAAAGIAMGLCALTKSVTLPFFLLACAWLWRRTGKPGTGLAAGMFVLATMAPWTLRNYFSYGGGYVMPVSTPWYSLYQASNDNALYIEMRGETGVPAALDVPSLINPKDWDYISGLPLPERDRLCKRKALAWIKEDPFRYFHLMRLRFLHFWRLYPMMAYNWQKYAAVATSGVYIPLCLIGMILSLREFEKTSLLMALFASHTAVHLVFFSMIRYRVPIDPYVIVFAAYAASEWRRALSPFLPAGKV